MPFRDSVRSWLGIRSTRSTTASSSTNDVNLLGPPQPSTSTSRPGSRTPSPNPSSYGRRSRTPQPQTQTQQEYQDVDMADYTARPIPPTHSRVLSLEVPSPRTSGFNTSPRPRSPSVLPPPDNESKALASLSTQCALSLATVVAELAPIPCIGILVGCLTVVFQAVEKSRVNK
jgi:hypothetical protein